MKPSESSDRAPRSMMRTTVVYAVVTIVQRGLPLLLLPIYTRALSPAEYGELGVLLAVSVGLSFLFSFGQEVALFRQLFKIGGEADRRRLIETSASLLLAVPLAGAAVLAVPGLLVVYRWLNVDRLDLGLVLVYAALYVSATVLPFTVLRAEERLRSFIRLTGFMTVITTVLTVTLVIWLDWGVTGWFAGAGLALLATWATSVHILPWPRHLKLHRDMMGELLRIGLPLIPHQVSLWGLHLSNRIILVGLVTKVQVAIFTLAATLALPVTFLAGAVLYAVFPRYGKAADDSAQRMILSRIVTAQITTIVSLGVTLALIGPLFCTLLFPPVYAPAATLVPVIAFGYALGALNAVPLNAAALLAGKTTFAWVATVLAAGANVGVLYAIVPSYGLEGAAFAVCVGNAALFLGTVVYSRFVARGMLAYEWRRVGMSLLVLVACYLGAVMTSGDDTVADLALRLVWLAAAAATLIRFRIVPIRFGQLRIRW